MNKRKSLLIGALLLLISGTALAFVLPPRISWNPAELNPASIAPGQTASFSVTLTHTGILPIPATNQLRVVAEGDILPFVTVTQPTFPPVIKRGNSVNINLTVTVPQGTPLSVVKGNLTLNRILPNGTTKEVWRADALPVELTLSAIPLPPDPGEMGKQTVEGIDFGGGPNNEPNGVRDDIDRYIAFTFPNSQKARMGLTQYAKEDQKFVADFLATASDPVEQKRVTRENAVERSKAMECSFYTLGVIDRKPRPDGRIYEFNADGTIVGDLGRKDEEVLRNAIKISDKLVAQFLNTTERQAVYGNADAHLGGTVSGDKGDDRTLCQSFGFDPDLLPN